MQTPFGWAALVAPDFNSANAKETPVVEGVVVKVAPAPGMVAITVGLVSCELEETALAALGPQMTPCWAAPVRLVAPVAAPLAALGHQLTPAGVALACRHLSCFHQSCLPYISNPS